MHRFSILSGLVGFLLCLSSFVNSQQVPLGDLVIELHPVASGMTSPVALVGAGDGSGRLFVVDQAGVVHVIDNGTLLAEPFLDVTDLIPELGVVFDERGLLGLAFHPDYANNGRFFVRYSAPRAGDPSEPCNDPDGFIVGCHMEVLAEYSVSATDPNRADHDSAQILLTMDQPQFNHDAGDLAFGPDGYLYIATGDGGGANDSLDDPTLPHGELGHGQDIETLLGAMLRIDVDNGAPYSIPADNPFVGQAGADEIYAYGLRNPYRFSFDSVTGDLWLGDVGQGIYEEVDIIELGGNYGWAVREGAHCFDPFNNSETPPDTFCDATGLIDPVAEYTHADGLSVVGGYVYRGSQFPELQGKYLFGEWSRSFGPEGRIFYIDPVPGLTPYQVQEVQIGAGSAAMGTYVKGIGEDDDGELYVITGTELSPYGTSGAVYRVIAPKEFLRGDSNSDDQVTLADVVKDIEYMFTNGSVECLDAVDANDDGVVNLADPIFTIQFLFLDGPQIRSPYPNCGLDPSGDATINLGCESVPCP